MEFITQTAFAFAVIGYIFCLNERKKWLNVAVFVFSILCLSTYIIAYVYLLLKGDLDWLKTVALISVVFFTVLAVKHYMSLP